MAYYIPTVWKSGGTRAPYPPPHCDHATYWQPVLIMIMLNMTFLMQVVLRATL